MAFVSAYPPAYNGTYVKATTVYGAGFEQYLTCDPSKSLTGDSTNNSWLTTNLSITNQRFHIDLGSAKTIVRIYYQNGHHSGAYTTRGAKNFTFWGSNSATAFATLTYTTDTDWTQLTIAQSTFDQHSASNASDPKYILVTNTTAYRYYAFKFADSYGDVNFMNIRRIELQIDDAPAGMAGAMTCMKVW